MILMAVGAGVSSAPVIGGVPGEANAVVEQAVTVSAGRVRLLNPDDSEAPPRPSAVFVLNTEGTGFTAAVSLATGDRFAIDMAMANSSLDQAAVDLSFESDVESFVATAFLVCPDVDGTLRQCPQEETTEEVTAVAPSGPNRFIVQVEPQSGGLDADGSALFELRVVIQVADTLAPGFYKTSLNMSQIET